MSKKLIIIWVVVGAVTGIVLEIFIGGMKIGLMGAILIGISGAIISGWAFNFFDFHYLTGIVGTVIEALIGAVLFLLIFGVFRKY